MAPKEPEIQLEEDFSQTRKVYTVSDLNRMSDFTLQDKFGSIWVEGEISNFTHSSAGHMYFSLKDAESTLQAAIFRGENMRLKFRPENGMKVLCRGRVGVYAKQGRYQLVADTMEPQGLGALQAAFEALKKKLAAEGLFAPERKRPLPYLPDCIGIVTSPTGAVIRDMLHVLARRHHGARIIFCPVQVQGENAKDEIARAIADLNEHGCAEVIIVARGGGSMEDLWAFNEETVARAIAGSRIPVISAVGHETDYTIADFVADLRAPTPSAAAELVAPAKEELVDQITGLRRALDRAALGQIETLRVDLENILNARVLRDPLEIVRENMQALDDVALELREAALEYVGRLGEQLRHDTSKLTALGPAACLLRGFAIAFRESDKKLIKSAQGLKIGDLLKLHLSDGEADARVENVRITKGKEND